jgi:pilus assembly protein CpaB
MKSSRAVVMLLVAALMGLGAVWVANNWLQSRVSSANTVQDGRVAVLAAARDIPFGKQIQEMDLRTVHLPADAVPAGAIREGHEAHGKVATQTIYMGELIMRERAAEHLGGSALSAVISPTKRAVTVRVNDVIGVAGFLLPGNRVDVLTTRRERNRDVRARTLLEDIKVLAVDQRASPDGSEPTLVRAVTLELTPRQAESLVKATQEGSLQLALRNPADNEKAPAAQPVSRPPRTAVAPTHSNVTVIRGIEVSNTRVAN